MSAQNTSDASPLSTGAAGTILEYRLAAVLLAKMLRSDSALGLASVQRIRLQGGVAGYPLDDIILFSSEADVPRVEIQVKRTMSPVASDKEFISVIKQCLKALVDSSDDVDNGNIQLCIASSGPVKQLEELKELAHIVHQHADYKSLSVVLVPRVTNKAICDRYNHVKAAVEKVSSELGESKNEDEINDLTFRLLKAVIVWVIEVGQDQRDTVDAINRLADILPDKLKAPDTYNHLVAIAEEIGPRAGSIEIGQLKSLLLRRGVGLDTDPKDKQNLAKLKTVTDRLLKGTHNTIGPSFHLPRLSVVEKVIQAASDNRLTLLSGPPGVGKTVTMYTAMAELAHVNTVVGLSLSRRNGQSLADIQAEFGVELASTLPKAATSSLRFFFIDGAEQMLTDGGQLLTSILATLPNGDSSPEWHVVVTVRSDVAKIIAQQLNIDNPPNPFNISELDDDEVNAVVKEFPGLVPLQRHPRSARLLRRPYIIDLINRTNVIADAKKPVGEEDVLAQFWQQVIRLNEGANPGRGGADLRQQISLEIAEATLTTTGLVKSKTVDNDALAGLRSDDILIRNKTYDQFAHDILLDYICAYRLQEEDSDVLIKNIVASRRFFRAFRLAAQSRLASDVNDPSKLVETWQSIITNSETLASKDGERWKDVPYLALINMGDPTPVLKVLQDDLVANKGERFFKLLNVTRHNAITSQLEEAGEEHEIDTVLVAPIMNMLSSIGDDFPFNSLYVAPELTRRWLLALRRREESPSDYIDNPTKLAVALTTWVDRESYGEQLEATLGALALLADFWPDEANELIQRISDKRPDEFSPMIENPDIAPIFAKLNPELCLRVALSYYLGWPPLKDAWTGSGMIIPSESFADDEREEGVRDHDAHYFSRRKQKLAHPSFGPFSALLQASPKHGIKLVSEVVEAASDARIKLENSFSQTKDMSAPVEIKLDYKNKDTQKQFRGTGHVWLWYRGNGVGPFPAISALMALREWSIQQLEQRVISEVMEEVLDMGISVAFVAVALSLLIARLDEIQDEMDMFLEQPHVWHLEAARLSQEGSLTAQHLSEDDPLLMPFERIAIYHVLKSTPERRQTLKDVGQRLVESTRREIEANTGSTVDDTHKDLLVVRKWGGMLNYDLYRREPADKEGYSILNIDHPEDLAKALNDGAMGSTLNLKVSGILYAAIKIRDGGEGSAAVELWQQLKSTIEELEKHDIKLEPYKLSDVMGGVAASLIIATVRKEVEPQDIDLQSASKALVDIANSTEPATALDDAYSDRGMMWSFGGDRSAASALPLLLFNPSLLLRSGFKYKAIEDALLRLAKSVSNDTRQRIGASLSPSLEAACSKQEKSLHDTTLKILNELIRSAGFGTKMVNYRMPATRITGNLATKLATDEHILSLGVAADAIPFLVKAAKLTCKHGEEATVILNALIAHDLLAWPKHYEGHHYMDTEYWRTPLDAYVAGRILGGDTELLNRYLEGFMNKPEGLSGILYQLAAQARETNEGVRLFELWDTVLDRLLPGSRTTLDDDRHRTSYRDTEELDKALLPLPEKGSVWPPSSAFKVLRRWTLAYQSSPRLIDRLILVMASYGVGLVSNTTWLILYVAGDDYRRILRSSALIVTWMRLIITNENANLVEEDRVKLIQFLDNLAKTGDVDALDLQRELEQ